METTIKTIEDLSLNAWPSHQIQLYDGWLLRFSYFYTHRTNSVEQIGLSSIPVDEKIKFCEDAYRRWGTPSIFKITPLLDPDFEKRLIKRDYMVQHITEVMLLDYAAYRAQTPAVNVQIEHTINARWINSLFALKSTTNAIHRQIVPSMYQAIPKDTLAASIVNEKGQIVAIGLGILDRSYIGIYAIHVHPYYRGRKYARSICTTLLNAGYEMGLKGAYLQVVHGNSPAKNLYSSLGFQDFYSYWFRVRDFF
ncbi:MAG: GNAT family N-acetyltransferase [Clostridia bacterium]|nr:GNAT family N-acetyltransferase [Clostridia bacterium]NCC42885.1 GNAT family N-acetyltransferase [Clostridia bacterium]